MKFNGGADLTPAQGTHGIYRCLVYCSGTERDRRSSPSRVRDLQYHDHAVAATAQISNLAGIWVSKVSKVECLQKHGKPSSHFIQLAPTLNLTWHIIAPLNTMALPTTPVTPTTPAGNKASTPATGTWRHPRFEEIARRQNATMFGEKNVSQIVWNSASLFLTFHVDKVLGML